MHIRHISLHEWFPATDPFAVAMARLCILREDLFLEWHGVIVASLDSLDAASKEWRRLYFFRHSVRTLYEIRRALQAIQAISSFKKALKQEKKAVQNRLNRLNKQFGALYEEIKAIRHHMVCHVEPEPIQKALEDTPLDSRGLIQHSSDPLKIHYKFARELMVEVLRSGHGGDDETVLALLDRIGQVFPVLVLIDEIFVIYARSKGLTRS